MNWFHWYLNGSLKEEDVKMEESKESTIKEELYNQVSQIVQEIYKVDLSSKLKVLEFKKPKGSSFEAHFSSNSPQILFYNLKTEPLEKFSEEIGNKISTLPNVESIECKNGFINIRLKEYSKEKPKLK